MSFLRRAFEAVGLDAVLPGVGSAGLAKDAVTPPDMPGISGAPTSPDNNPAAIAAIAEAARQEREARLRALGRASTIMTTGEGDKSAPSLARRFLLGG